MIEDLKSHKLHYLVLLTILLLGFGGFLYYSFDRPTQLLIGVATSISYAVWGIVHHYSENNLNWKIVIEYSLFSLIALALISSLVLRS